MADIKIDPVKAEMWVAQVKEELARVRITLEEVDQVATGEKSATDCIDLVLRATSSHLQEKWKETTDGFDNAWEKIQLGVDYYLKLFQGTTEKFNH